MIQLSLPFNYNLKKGDLVEVLDKTVMTSLDEWGLSKGDILQFAYYDVDGYWCHEIEEPFRYFCFAIEDIRKI